MKVWQRRRLRVSSGRKPNTDFVKAFSMKPSALIFAAMMTGFALTSCSGKTETPAPVQSDTSQILPAENKMVVLPANMTLGSAVIHPPRAQDGFGDMSQQTIGAFNGLHTLLTKQGLSLGNVMRVRVTLVAGEDGSVDYDGYMSAYKKFYGTQKLPNEPLHSMSAARSLPVKGQLVLIEADIAVPVKETIQEKAE